jgi:hypothetical protein
MQMNATNPAPARQRKPRTKPARHVRLALKPFEGNPGVVEITVGRNATAYFLSPVSADFGTGYRLEKFESGEVYHVNLAAGDLHTCDCKGFLQWGHCKHIQALLALYQAGQL